MTPVFPLCLLDPAGQACSAQGGVSGEGPGTCPGLAPGGGGGGGGTPALSRSFSVHLSPAACGGEGKKGVKFSTHMAPLFTMRRREAII